MQEHIVPDFSLTILKFPGFPCKWPLAIPR